MFNRVWVISCSEICQDNPVPSGIVHGRDEKWHILGQDSKEILLWNFIKWYSTNGGKYLSDEGIISILFIHYVTTCYIYVHICVYMYIHT